MTESKDSSGFRLPCSAYEAPIDSPMAPNIGSTSTPRDRNSDTRRNSTSYVGTPLRSIMLRTMSRL